MKFLYKLKNIFSSYHSFNERIFCPKCKSKCIIKPNLNDYKSFKCENCLIFLTFKDNIFHSFSIINKNIKSIISPNSYWKDDVHSIKTVRFGFISISIDCLETITKQTFIPELESYYDYYDFYFRYIDNAIFE